VRPTRPGPLAATALLALALAPRTAAAPEAPRPPAGPDAEVRILTDRWGVPHLRAASLGDLYFAWGYVTARDRLWQLEYQRQAARGRLWRWFGNATLTVDGGAQLFRLAERAEALWARERADPATALALGRFADGVNAWLARCRSGTMPWPPELRRLGARMEDWRPEDSLALLLGMGVQLDLDLPELGEARDAGRFGAAWLAERRRYESRWTYSTTPDATGRHTATVAPAPASATPGTATLGAAARAAERALAGLVAAPDADGAGRASNAFAAGPARSASGAALLANDPHLPLASPGALYVVHLTAPGVVDAAGACAPGLPAIVSGRNRTCAWGLTALSADVVDVYADTLSRDGRRVRWGAGWAPVVERPYDLRYRVLGLVPVSPPGQVRRYTPHGPVVAWDRRRGVALSVRWSAFEDERITLRAMLGVERSRSAGEVAERFATLITPTFNVVAADRAGRVVYRACGLVPVRRFAAIPGPLPGDGRHEWDGFLPAAAMPAWRPPADGFVVNANNLPAPPTETAPWPRFDWAHDRALRIAERLGGDRSLTAADLKSVQNDVHSAMAARFVPALLAAAEPAVFDPRARAALDTLRRWDFAARRDRVAPTLWRAWYAALARRWGLEGLPARLLAALAGESRAWPPGRAPESLAAGAAAALDSALAALGPLLGSDPARWTWARAHRARFASPLGRWAGARAEFEPATVPVDGDNASPAVAPSRLPHSVEVGHGPVFRHVVDLAVADSSWMVVPPGNSMASPALARAMLQRWRDHGYVALRLDPSSIEREAIEDVTLAAAR
jgi:penicillin amidase